VTVPSFIPIIRDIDEIDLGFANSLLEWHPSLYFFFLISNLCQFLAIIFCYSGVADAGGCTSYG
jgi:hypothetical protein